MSSQIDHLLNENRRFAPPADFAANAVAAADLYERAAADREGFWADQARDLHWHKPFTRGPGLDATRRSPSGSPTASSTSPTTAWTATSRPATATVSRSSGRASPAMTAGSRTPSSPTRSSASRTCWRSLGIGEGDRVAIYLPMIPEAIAAMLAVARIGAIHSVVFGGFSADSLRSRIDDAGAKLVITADGGYRKGKVSPLKPAVDLALGDRNGSGTQETVENVLVVRRGENDVDWVEGRDLWWHDVVPAASADHEAKAFPAENPLFILYTSGTTGKPKGILHTSGGYLTQAAFTNKVVHDIHPETDVYWCTADIGWITGHSYVTYGPLANGATQVLYEGTPDTPHPGRWWEIVEKYGVTILYTAPTAIRSFMKIGRAVPKKFDLSSLRLLGSVGEPINPEAWMWYRKIIGGKTAPIVDTWWQTETGAMMISALPGVTETKPGSAQVPLPGISIDVVDEDGSHVGNGNGGLLVVTEPWPSMLRGIWGDPERFKETYWDKFEKQGFYFAGDGARLDEDGDVWLLGRVDDVMNVSGHRLSTTEIESALVGNEAVAEAAVVGASDETTGQAVVAFVIIKESYLKEHSAAGLANSLRLLGRRADRPHRPAPRRLHRRRAAQDPLGQDHAPASSRRRRGSRGRRHDDPRRHGGHVRDQRPGQVSVR